MLDRIRVVLISEPGFAGVKRHVIDLLEQIDLESFDVYFIYSLIRGDENFADEVAALEARGISCIEVPMRGSLSITRDPQVFGMLIRQLQRIRPHVVHLHSSIAGGLGRLASLCVWPRPRIVYTPHAMACERSRIYWFLEVCLGLVTDRAIAVSKSEHADWIRWKIPKAKRAAVINNGFAVPSSSGVIPREIPQGTTWTFGACGRICRQKNALLMFQTAIEMIGRDPHARFVWIGDFSDDNEAASVRSLLQTYGKTDRIEITGWLPAVEGRLRQLDVFCMISRYEGLSYVLGEAQLLQLPVVGVDAPGIIDLVEHDVTGIIARPQIGSLCDALFKLRDDRELRRRLGDAARQQIVSNYTIPRMAEEIEGVYRDQARRGNSLVRNLPQRHSDTLLEQGK